MGRHDLNNLLILAGLFEKKALTALAQTDPNFPGNSFAYQLKLLAHVRPTDEQWQSWLEGNRTAMGHLPWEAWEYDGAAMYHRMPRTPKATEGVYAYITNSAAPPSPSFEEKRQSVLKGSPPIPTLWLWIGDPYGRSEPLSANIAHDAWLYEAISKTIGITSRLDFFNFVTANRAVIDRIRQSFKTANPTYLGGGTDGVAFDIGDGRILKVFKDQVSYEKAKQAFDRLHKSPALAKTEAMLYDVGILGRFGGYPEDPKSGQDVYYYIMEKMIPLHTALADTSQVRKILDFVINEIEGERASKWRQLKLMILDPTKEELIKNEVKNAAAKWATKFIDYDPGAIDYIEGALPSLKPKPNLKSKWLPLYIEEILMKYLTGRTDLHMGNIGVTGYGELRYYDPAYSSWESNINS